MCVYLTVESVDLLVRQDSGFDQAATSNFLFYNINKHNFGRICYFFDLYLSPFLTFSVILRRRSAAHPHERRFNN